MISLPCSTHFYIDNVEFNSAGPLTTAIQTCNYKSSLRTECDEFFINNISYS